MYIYIYVCTHACNLHYIHNAIYIYNNASIMCFSDFALGAKKILKTNQDPSPNRGDPY